MKDYKKICLTAAVSAMTLMSGMVSAAGVSVWYHGAGNITESEIVNQIISDFNASQSNHIVSMESFPQESYNDSVEAAGLAGNLPCVIDVDGPVMPRWAWAGYMQPLPLDGDVIADFLPGTKGIWNGELYSIGMWDAAVALFARQSTLDDLGLRTPTLDNPWTQIEFSHALHAAKSSNNFDYALDLGMAWKGEWFPYAFSPLLQSFGGDMIDRSTYLTAEGALNGPEAIAFGNYWQSLFAEGYAPGNSQDGADRDTGFIEGKYAFSWNGNWAGPSALAAVDDVVFLPAPDFGNGPKIGAGSWQWGVSSSCNNVEGASAFIEHALQDEYLTAFSDLIGLVPSTASAALMSKNYASGGALEVFFGLSDGQALIRPVTPGYPVAAKVFEKALADIADGADVVETLDAAVDEIDADIEANNGYGN